MDRPIIFITRSWHGTGGMQRYCKDLSGELAALYGDNLICIHPTFPGIMGLIGFMMRSFFVTIRYRNSNGYMHLGDMSLLPLGRIVKRMTGMRLSLTCYGLDILYPMSIYQWMIRRALPSADCIVCISRATADALKTKGVPDEKIHIIPCGITDTVPILSAERDPNLLLTVGRLVPRKGVPWFTENVLPLLIKEHESLRYTIIGSGPEVVRIRECIRRKNLEQYVTLLTDVPDADRDQLLDKAVVFVMPNVRIPGTMEGFGIACIEAAVHGAQIAASDIEGLKDSVIEGETGRFFPSEDAQACADTILNMLRDPLDSALVRETALARFAWPRIIQRYRDEVFI
jgi:glycosyltransferase involved in cell wall biosynthesis